MPQNARKSLVVAERRQQIANLYLQGWTQASIAEQLQIAQTTVSRDLETHPGRMAGFGDPGF